MAGWKGGLLASAGLLFAGSAAAWYWCYTLFAGPGCTTQASLIVSTGVLTLSAGGMACNGCGTHVSLRSDLIRVMRTSLV